MVRTRVGDSESVDDCASGMVGEQVQLVDTRGASSLRDLSENNEDPGISDDRTTPSRIMKRKADTDVRETGMRTKKLRSDTVDTTHSPTTLDVSVKGTKRKADSDTDTETSTEMGTKKRVRFADEDMLLEFRVGRFAREGRARRVRRTASTSAIEDTAGLKTKDISHPSESATPTPSQRDSDSQRLSPTSNAPNTPNAPDALQPSPCQYQIKSPSPSPPLSPNSTNDTNNDTNKKPKNPKKPHDAETSVVALYDRLLQERSDPSVLWSLISRVEDEVDVVGHKNKNKNKHEHEARFESARSKAEAVVGRAWRGAAGLGLALDEDEDEDVDELELDQVDDLEGVSDDSDVTIKLGSKSARSVRSSSVRSSASPSSSSRRPAIKAISPRAPRKDANANADEVYRRAMIGYYVDILDEYDYNHDTRVGLGLWLRKLDGDIRGDLDGMGGMDIKDGMDDSVGSARMYRSSRSSSNPSNPDSEREERFARDEKKALVRHRNQSSRSGLQHGSHSRSGDLSSSDSLTKPRSSSSPSLSSQIPAKSNSKGKEKDNETKTETKPRPRSTTTPGLESDSDDEIQAPSSHSRSNSHSHSHSRSSSGSGLSSSDYNKLLKSAKKDAGAYYRSNGMDDVYVYSRRHGVGMGKEKDMLKLKLEKDMLKLENKGSYLGVWSSELKTNEEMTEEREEVIEEEREAREEKEAMDYFRGYYRDLATLRRETQQSLEKVRAAKLQEEKAKLELESVQRLLMGMSLGGGDSTRGSMDVEGGKMDVDGGGVGSSRFRSSQRVRNESISERVGLGVNVAVAVEVA